MCSVSSNLDLFQQGVLQNIVLGTAEVIPAGMEQFDTANNGSGQVPVPSEDFSNHQYLRAMNHRGGGYAILMAFHKQAQRLGHHDFDLTKAEIISMGQPFCDTEMNPTWHQQQFGGSGPPGWQSIKSLERYHFVRRLSNQAARARSNFTGGLEKDLFRLTSQGVQFVEEMLKKFPDNASLSGGNFLGQCSGGSGAAARRRGPPPSGSRGPRASSPFDMDQTSQEDQQKFAEDEEELDEFCQCHVGAEKEFKKISKARRKRLHDLCDNVMPDRHGVQLKHESYNDGSNRRTLLVTVMSKRKKRLREDDDWLNDFDTAGGASRAQKRPVMDDDYDEEAEIERAMRASLLDSAGRAAAPCSAGLALGGGSSTGGKRPVSKTPAQAAAEAAAARAALSAQTNRFQPPGASASGGDGVAGAGRNCGNAGHESRKLAEDFDSESSGAMRTKLDLASGQRRADRIKVPTGCRMVGNGALEILDEDKASSAVIEIEELKPACEIEDSKDLIVIESQELDDSAEERAVQAAITASMLGCVAADANRTSLSGGKSRLSREEGKMSAESSSSARASMSSPCAQDQDGSEHLRILVDTSERRKNAEPRELCRRLKLWVEKEEEAGKFGGQKALKKEDVEQKKLDIGDFAAVRVKGDDGDGEKEQLLAVIERKTINDLVGRSEKGDHLRQVGHIRNALPPSVSGFLLLEGNAKSAERCSVHGLISDADASHGKALGSSVVQDEGHYKELLAWLVFTDKALGGPGSCTVRALQTKDMEQSLALLSALSMCAAFRSKFDGMARLPVALDSDDGGEADECFLKDLPKFVRDAKKMGKDMVKKLQEEGIPSKAASELEHRFGSVHVVESCFDACKSDESMSMLLDIADISEWNDAQARRAIVRRFAPRAEGFLEPTAADDSDGDDVVDLTVAPGRGTRMQASNSADTRVSHIEASADMLNTLLPDETSKQELARCPWLKIKEWSGAREVPVLWLTIRCCSRGVGGLHRESLPVRLSIVRGPEVVEAILKASRLASNQETNPCSWQFRTAAAAAKILIEQHCDSNETLGATPRILVLEGVERARLAEQRKNGTADRVRQGLLLLCNMLVSCLLMSHCSLTVWQSNNSDDTRGYVYALARVCRSQALLVS